jgi:hypothetical protein
MKAPASHCPSVQRFTSPLVTLLNPGKDNSYPQSGSSIHRSPESFEDFTFMDDLKPEPGSRRPEIPWNDMASKQAQVPRCLYGLMI